MQVEWVVFMHNDLLKLAGKSKNNTCFVHSTNHNLRVNVCDLPEKYEQLKKEFEGIHINVVYR